MNSNANNSPASDATSEGNTYDWPLAYEAEHLLYQYIEAFLLRHRCARNLADRMRDESGTEFYEWVDHLTMSPDHRDELVTAGMTVEEIETPGGVTVLHHPKAMMPRVFLCTEGSTNGVPATLAVKPEVLAEFLRLHAPEAKIEGKEGARYRLALVAEENGLRLEAVERLGYRGFTIDQPEPGFVEAIREGQKLFSNRQRDFNEDGEGAKHAMVVVDQVLTLVPRDVACELFFAEERRFWELRNHAGRVQKKRQDSLGLGWGNHDHHTFRCSRGLFPDLVQFLEKLGLQKRERFYAGAEAGWGAQVLESPNVGIVVFADVDLRPDEVNEDYATKCLPEVERLGTVGLWCELHGDSFLQAGMHHLEARFDFIRLRDQLAKAGVGTMAPFSNFPFLKQAFTEGERWFVKPARVAKLKARGLITSEQADAFLHEGAIGSHLENLQRKGGFKGFNQKAVSAIIAQTDPRKAAKVS